MKDRLVHDSKVGPSAGTPTRGATNELAMARQEKEDRDEALESSGSGSSSSELTSDSTAFTSTTNKMQHKARTVRSWGQFAQHAIRCDV